MGSDHEPHNVDTGGFAARKIGISPLEAAILHLLYYERREMDRTEIREAVEPLFGRIAAGDFVDAMSKLEKKWHIESHYVMTDDGGSLSMRYSLTANALETHFSWAVKRRQAGSDSRVEIMRMIADQQMRKGHYCRPDTHEWGNGMTDMAMAEPETVDHMGCQVFSQSRWNERTVLFVVVETDPAKHRDRIRAVWKNNGSMCNIWFIVFTEKHSKTIKEILDGHGAPPGSCIVTPFPKEDVLSKNDVTIEVPCLSSGRNLTDHGLGRRPKNGAPLMSALEYKVWSALDVEKRRTFEQVRDALKDQPDADAAAINRAFLTLSTKRIIRISGKWVMRNRGMSMLYEMMLRDGKPVVKAEVGVEYNATGRKLVARHVESRNADRRRQIEGMNMADLISLYNSNSTTHDDLILIKDELKSRGWLV